MDRCTRFRFRFPQILSHGVSGRFIREERDRFAALVAEGPTRSVWDMLGELGIQEVVILEERSRSSPSEREAAWRKTTVKDMKFKELISISKFAGGNAAAYGKGRLNGRSLGVDAEDVGRATGFYSHENDGGGVLRGRGRWLHRGRFCQCKR